VLREISHGRNRIFSGLIGVIVALNSDFQTGVWVFLGSMLILLAIIGYSRLSEKASTSDTYADY
jgi:hypothetical protein